MTSYSKDRLKLIAQGITGSKIWAYEDTGATQGTVGLSVLIGDTS